VNPFILEHSKKIKKKLTSFTDLDRALNRPVAGLFFTHFNPDHATLLKLNSRKIPGKLSLPALFFFEMKKKEQKKNEEKGGISLL
jgi:glyoxylase-like metal-dependent hydrolase (beta-lactamase superfamily II)